MQRARAVVFLVALSAACAHGGKAKKMSEQICGVTISAPTAKLIAEVEKLHGRPVQFDCDAVPPAIVATAYSTCRIADDGAPIVRLNKNKYPVPESDIAHELLHLKHFAEGGFPYKPYWLTIRPYDSGADDGVYQELHDDITHVIIYPELERIGYRPDERLAAEVRSIPTAAERAMWIAVWSADRLRRTTDYFKYAMLIRDARLLKPIDEIFEAHGWATDRDIARSWVQRVKARNPKTRQDTVDLFVECANELRSDGRKIAFWKWGPEVGKASAVFFTVLVPGDPNSQKPERD